MDDPYAALGLERGASAEEVARRYRELAKRFHPDLAGVSEAGKMAEINAAYERVRRGEDGSPARESEAAGGPGRRPSARRSRPGPGAWLAPALRQRLGGEIVRALEPEEPVLLVADAVEGSSVVRLAVTDRRLLWLRDDSVTGRVRSERFGAIARVEGRLRRPLRRTGVLAVTTTAGRRHRFSDLAPDVLSRLVHLVGPRVRAGAA